jgi:sarcosine oxidase
MGTPESETVRGSLASVREHDLEHELLEASQINGRFPGFRVPDEVVAVYQPDGGFVLSERAIAGHARLAIEAGAELHGHEAVESWVAGDAGVTVRTAVAEYRARHLVISAGAWVGKLVPSLATVAVPERQVLIWVQAKRPELYRPDRLPVFILDMEDLYFGLPEYGIPGLKFGIMHHRREVIDPDAWDRSTIEPADEAVLRAGISRYLPEADGPVLTFKTCMYTNAPDEHFTLGPLPGTPNVTIVSPCSGHGYKFASVVGEIAADLALDGGTRHDIEMFSTDRFETAA